MKLRYTPIDEVQGILNERKNNEELQQKLRLITFDIEPGGPYECSDEEASLVFAEYVARPTNRDIDFALRAVKNGLSPTWATYRTDKFTTTNKKKVGMLRPPLAFPNGQNTRQWIVEAQDRQAPNIEIGNVKTRFNSRLTVSEYWQELRKLVLPRWGLDQSIDSVVDLSDAYRRWATMNGENGDSIAKGYYGAIMGMYAGRTALYADFDSYPEFKTKVAQPAYEAVADITGFEPVIVKPAEVDPNLLEKDNSRRLDVDQTDLTFLSSPEVSALQKTGCINGGVNYEF